MRRRGIRSAGEPQRGHVSTILWLIDLQHKHVSRILAEDAQDRNRLAADLAVGERTRLCGTTSDNQSARSVDDGIALRSVMELRLRTKRYQ